MICSPKVFCSTMQKIQYTKLKKRNHVSIIPEIKEPEPTPPPETKEETTQNSDQKITEASNENADFLEVSIDNQTNQTNPQNSAQTSNPQQIQTNPTQNSEQHKDNEQINISAYTSPISNNPQQSDNTKAYLNPANPFQNGQNAEKPTQQNTQNQPTNEGTKNTSQNAEKIQNDQNNQNTSGNIQNPSQIISENKDKTTQNTSENAPNQNNNNFDQIIQNPVPNPANPGDISIGQGDFANPANSFPEVEISENPTQQNPQNQPTNEEAKNATQNTENVQEKPTHQEIQNNQPQNTSENAQNQNNNNFGQIMQNPVPNPANPGTITIGQGNLSNPANPFINQQNLPQNNNNNQQQNEQKPPDPNLAQFGQNKPIQIQNVTKPPENAQKQTPQNQDPALQPFPGFKFKSIRVGIKYQEDDQIVSVLARNSKDTWQVLISLVNKASNIDEIMEEIWNFIEDSLTFAPENQHPSIIFQFTILVNYLCTIYPEFFDRLFEDLSQEIQSLKDTKYEKEQTYCHYYVAYLLNLLFANPDRAIRYGVPYIKRILTGEQNYVVASHSIIYIYECSPTLSAIDPTAHDEIIQLIKRHMEIIKNMPREGKLKYFYSNLCTVMNNSNFCFAPKDNTVFNKYFYWIQ